MIKPGVTEVVKWLAHLYHNCKIYDMHLSTGKLLSIPFSRKLQTINKIHILHNLTKFIECVIIYKLIIFYNIGVKQMMSLVGLKAVDIVRELGAQGNFNIGSYGRSICTVVPVINNCDDLVDLFYFMSRKLNCSEYTIVKRPTNQSELAKVYRELEKDLQDENKVD